jgi:hypothetical protein
MVLNKTEEKLTLKFLSVFGESFRHGFFFVKQNSGVFGLPLPSNVVQQRPFFLINKKSEGGWVGLGFSKCTRTRQFLFWRPIGVGSIVRAGDPGP